MKYVPEAYYWLSSQLQQHLSAYEGGLPWFAYCDKPDLRWVRHRLPANRQFVRIEIEPAPDSFFVFPCWAWDIIYCGQYLALSQDEHDEWVSALEIAVPNADDILQLPEPWLKKLQISWERLFSPELLIHRCNDHPVISNTSDREAVLGTLRLEEVREITPFFGSSCHPFHMVREPEHQAKN